MHPGTSKLAGVRWNEGNLSETGRRGLERVMGIEPTLVAWEATVLPLNYTRKRYHLKDQQFIRTVGPLQSLKM